MMVHFFACMIWWYLFFPNRTITAFKILSRYIDVIQDMTIVF